ncbi:P-protein [Diaporthe amygdali]|uniref:P-protein n=1 Tax=Phomopsis amygdali TaxID=1214568 RepID=UPI0022FDB6BB|nr:P-protein [Diaporthe amygdali]KAJ0116467.1 P-protein [Diaporthe amygdali]
MVQMKEQRGEETTPKRPLVAFLGPPSSFTHQATKSAFSEDDHTLTPVATIKDVFDAVAAGGADYGVVPFENSTHGVVTFTLGYLADRDDIYGDLTVCGEVYIDVHHFLLGHARPGAAAAAQTSAARGTPQHDLSHVQRVYSHPQAFGQTQAFLSAHLPGVEAIDVSSTSKAAEMASGDASGATAAISNESAAAAFGLDVLARCIEDRDDNTTRFFVLRRRRASDEGEREKEEGEKAKGEAPVPAPRGHKSLVSFTVPHRSPGALAAVLDVFRKVGLNLTSINSLPSLIQPFQYLFLVEFDGSRYHDPEGKVEAALDEVAKVAESWRWLGSWENQR